MIRNLYFWLVARRHIGEAVAFDTEDAELCGTLEHAGVLGCRFRQANENIVHLPYGRLNAIATGARVASVMAEAASRAAERLKAPEPAIFGDELRRMLEEELA